MQADTAACQSQSTQAASAAAAPTTQPTRQGGGRLRGAAVGAAAGAAGAEARGNDYEAYDRVDDDVKEDYRRNEAEDAAAGQAQPLARRASAETVARMRNSSRPLTNRRHSRPVAMPTMPA